MLVETHLAFASIAEIGKLYRSRKLSPVELTRFLLDRIARLNPRVNAYRTVCDEQALEQAARTEKAFPGRRRGKSAPDLGPLHGIPISLKDNIYTAGIHTTAGSKILQNFAPLHDAPLVTALKKAGAIILGKTNMHEFAYGATSNNPHYGPVRNPWDETRIAGGSSGGSAAALSAGLCFGSIGTDTGGSIRIPSSLCGVVGLKPGLGRVSAEDVIPLSPTLDSVGPLARTVEDAALLLQPIFRRGANERNLLPREFPSPRARRAKLGIPKEFFFDVVSPEVQRAFDRSLDILKRGGASIEEVSLSLLKEVDEAANHIATAEATLYHQQAGWFPDRSADYGEDVRLRLEMGAKVSAVSYLKALQTREEFIAAFHLALQDADVDALVVPTTPMVAPPIGEESTSIRGTLHPTRGLLLRLTRPANLAGVPAISVPCGLTEEGLPAGLQFIGAVTDEALLLEFACQFEQAVSCEAHPVLD